MKLQHQSSTAWQVEMCLSACQNNKLSVYGFSHKHPRMIFMLLIAGGEFIALFGDVILIHLHSFIFCVHGRIIKSNWILFPFSSFHVMFDSISLHLTHWSSIKNLIFIYSSMLDLPSICFSSRTRLWARQQQTACRYHFITFPGVCDVEK